MCVQNSDSRNSKTFLARNRNTLDILPFEEENVFSPDIIGFSHFLKTLTKRNLKCFYWANYLFLQELDSLFVF